MPADAAERIAAHWREVESVHDARRELADYLVSRLSGKRPVMYEVATREMPVKTGNAGGAHNLLVAPTLTGGMDAMLSRLGTGLLVTELMGQGVNMVTGDYSRGAAGFWVENGSMQYPVAEITIAGNLREMLRA